MAEATTQPSEASNLSFSMKMTVYGISKKFQSVRNVGCDQLELWRQDKQEKLVILDTRPLEEYLISHLPGAIQVDPNDDISWKALSIAPDSRVVCYCSVGYRSSAVAQKLFSQHKRNTRQSSVDTQRDIEQSKQCHDREHKEPSAKLDIYNLEGGIFQWACEQREIVNERGEKVNTVHPYSAFWGKLLPAQLRHKF